ncbi:NUDIX domain-containing protein [Candidatus Saccharibacteria bacterium]|nr:NUDIX domain-containing protein [Candidatus Saccharibacteria bacterium]
MTQTEYAIIVDEDDNILEYRDRKDVSTYDLHRIVAIWVTNRNGDVLLAQRAHTMCNQPSLWGPAAAGTVAKGESYLETAQRELAEEVGISNIALEEAGKFRTDREFGECRMCVVFVGTYDGDIATLKLQPEEVDAVKWMKPDELQRAVMQNPEQYVINMQNVIDAIGN